MDTRKAGKLGGRTTLKKYGSKHYSKIAKDAWAKRNKILSAFTIGDLSNPITKKSIIEKLEQVDSEAKNNEYQ
jgi:hypothetical protein